MKTARLATCLLGVVIASSACGGATPTADSGDSDAMTVVAATAWEGSLARAAGATDVTVVVPASVVHAADYDPRPSDLVAVADADLVLYAEFEGFADRLREAAGGDARVEAVQLDNDPTVVRAEVLRLAELMGTTDAARQWLVEFDTTVEQASQTVRDAWRDGQPPRVVTQAFVGYMAALSGAEVVGTYGPQPITPGQVADLTSAAPDLVLDNVHMSTGPVLPDAGARQVSIINYPGDDLDLLTVFTTNAEQIASALRG